MAESKTTFQDMFYFKIYTIGFPQCLTFLMIWAAPILPPSMGYLGLVQVPSQPITQGSGHLVTGEENLWPFLWPGIHVGTEMADFVSPGFLLLSIADCFMLFHFQTQNPSRS